MTTTIAIPDIVGNTKQTISKFSRAELASASLVVILPSLVAIEGWRRRSESRLTPSQEEAGPKIGEPLPDLVLQRPRGETVSVADLLEASWSDESVLLFVTFNCAPCRSLIEALDSSLQQGRQKYPLHLIARNSDLDDGIRGHRLDSLSPRLRATLILEDSPMGSIPLTTALNVRSLPTAVLVSSSDRTLKAAATGKEEIIKLLDL